MWRHAAWAVLFAGIAVGTVWSGLESNMPRPLVSLSLLSLRWNQGRNQNTEMNRLDIEGIKNIRVLAKTPKQDYSLFVYCLLNILSRDGRSDLIRTVWADDHITNLQLKIRLVNINIVRNGSIKIFDRVLWRLRHNTGLIWHKGAIRRFGGPNTLRNPADFESSGVNFSSDSSPII